MYKFWRAHILEFNIDSPEIVTMWESALLIWGETSLWKSEVSFLYQSEITDKTDFILSFGRL